MKSSSSALISSTKKHSRIAGWEPMEFNGPSYRQPEMSVDEVLDLFIGDQKSTTRSARQGANSERAAFNVDETNDVLAWNPTEIKGNHARPFQPGHFSGNNGSDRQSQDFSYRFLNAYQQGQQTKGDFEVSLQQRAERIIAEAKQKASEIVAGAQSEADELISEAQNNIDAVYEQARQDGYQEIEEEMGTILSTVNNMVEQVSAWKEEMLHQGSSMIIDVITDIAQSMFGNGLVLDGESLQQNLNRIIDNAKNLGHLRVYLSPVDAGNLDPYWKEFQSSLTGSKVQIYPSEGITPGGCFIHGEMGSVDARVETQLRSIIETLHTEQSTEESF